MSLRDYIVIVHPPQQGPNTTMIRNALRRPGPHPFDRPVRVERVSPAPREVEK